MLLANLYGVWQMSPMPHPTRWRSDLRRHWPAFAVAGAGMALRLVHVVATRPILVDQPAPEGMDRWLTIRVAETIARGDWTGGWLAPYDSSPAYSYFAAGAYVLCGRNWFHVLVVQAALGALTPLVLYGVGLAIDGESTALVAALIAALYLPSIFYEGLVVKFALIPLAVSAALLSVVGLRAGGRGAALASGAALGAVVLLRPNTALAAPVIAAWGVLGGATPAIVIRRTALVVVGAMAILGPMAARDALTARHGLSPGLAGIHFYIGTNPHADGEYTVIDDIRPDIVGHVVDARRIAERRMGRTLSPADVSRFWFHRGLSFIRDRPGRYVLLEVRKLWLAFEAAENGSFGDDYDGLRPVSPVLRLPAITFATVGPLGLLGLAGCIRRRRWLLPLALGALTLSLLPFFMAGRYRLPLAPPMIVLAACGLRDIARWVGARGLWLLGVLIPALALAATALGAGDVEVCTLVATVGIGVYLITQLDKVGNVHCPT